MNEMAFLGGVAALYFVLAASPGPNFIVITHAAASRSRSYAVALSAGVSTASVAWAGLAVAGLGVFIARYGELYHWLQLAGGAYLVCLGARTLRAGSKATAPCQASLADGLFEAWRLGLWTNMTNPKSLVFFSSAFAALFSPELPFWLRWAAVAVVGAISLGWNLAVATLFSRHDIRRLYQRSKRWIDGASGSVLTFFGLRLAFRGASDLWDTQRG